MSGLEWIVEAHGCDSAALADAHRLEELFHNWHQFPGTGGITGVTLLTESHLACHTFPEYGSLCLNIFCCRPRPATDFAALLTKAFGAARVSVRQVERPYQI